MENQSHGEKVPQTQENKEIVAENLVNDSRKIETTQKETKPIRDERGRLLPGVILNPEGKRVGTKHFRTLFVEAVKEIGAKNSRGEDISKDKVIVKKVIDMAINGNLKAIDTVLDRIDGKVQNEQDPSNININVVMLTEEQKKNLEQLL